MRWIRWHCPLVMGFEIRTWWSENQHATSWSWQTCSYTHCIRATIRDVTQPPHWKANRRPEVIDPNLHPPPPPARSGGIQLQGKTTPLWTTSAWYCISIGPTSSTLALYLYNIRPAQCVCARIPCGLRSLGWSGTLSITPSTAPQPINIYVKSHLAWHQVHGLYK